VEATIKKISRVETIVRMMPLTQYSGEAYPEEFRDAAIRLCFA
jgi:hypothetical protein